MTPAAFRKAYRFPAKQPDEEFVWRFYPRAVTRPQHFYELSYSPQGRIFVGYYVVGGTRTSIYKSKVVDAMLDTVRSALPETVLAECVAASIADASSLHHTIRNATWLVDGLTGELLPRGPL